MRSGPYTGGAVLLPWHAIDLKARRKLLGAQPIVAERRRAKNWAMFAVASACGLALVLLSGAGFGQLYHPWLIERGWLVVPYALLLAGIVVPSAWLARRVLSAGAWLPYERALLALDAIEHTAKGLVVRPFGDARHALVEGGFVELRYADTSTFRIRAHDLAAADRALSDAETTLARASLSDDAAYRAEVDPFSDLRDERGFVARARAKRLGTREGVVRDGAFVVAAVVLVLASFAAAWPLLGLRNRMSDDAAFDYVRPRDSEDLYETYLRDGGTRHAREVREELLPRIVLTSAEQHLDPDAFDSYLDRFPSSRFDAEARAGLARSCALAGETYIRAASAPPNDIFNQLAYYTRKHPACTRQGAEMAARYFEQRRELLRKNERLTPEMRRALLDLLDESERTGKPATFWLGHSAPSLTLIEHLAQPIQAKRAGPSGVRTGAYLAIQDEPLICSAGSHAAESAFVAHFRLYVDGELRSEWRKAVNDETGLFRAATEGWDAHPCYPVMP